MCRDFPLITPSLTRGEKFQNFFLYCNKINNSYISHQSRHFFSALQNCRRIGDTSKGAFINNIHKILSFFDHLPKYAGWHLWRNSYTVKYKEKSAYNWNFQYHLPTLSCQRSLWTSPKGENSHFNVCIFARRARIGFVRNSISTVHSLLSIGINYKVVNVTTEF